MKERRVKANDVEFSYLEAGPDGGPLALCLHGFPDSAHTWRHLLPALGDAGYHAVAPWMRGYAPTQVPADGRYQTGALAADAGALHETLGGDGRAVLIGHDWGAAAATGAAVHEPTRWSRVVTMAVPPLAAMASSFFTYAQLKRSFYIFVFQTPLAEAAVSLDDHAFIDGLWADWSPGYDASWDVARVKEAIGGPDNLTAAIGYYRAMFDPTLQDPVYAAAQAATAGTPPQPTLYLHGADDGCLARDAVGDVLPFLSPGSEQVTVADAGHFLQVEQPGVVNDHILRFIGSP
ncbi:MAG TPA: alpha/beta hydrolase [Acidimicrobiales bacterium]|nr:alpha/beta hydrolase [Acidimicrobiales bacterium]